MNTPIELTKNKNPNTLVKRITHYSPHTHSSFNKVAINSPFIKLEFIYFYDNLIKIDQ